MKKLTYEFVKSKFEEEGYELLSTEYVNSKIKLKYRCPNGHEHSITYAGWCIGNRCPYCSKKIKKTISEIKIHFENEGYTLLTTEYKNASTYLEYICPNGHSGGIRWYNWISGHRCPVCAGQVKPTIEEIRASFEAEGYTLLSTIYYTNKNKLRYICPEGHRHSISWIKWCQGRRCRECSYITRGINLSGPNSPNWNGGSSNAPYCVNWTAEFKNYIKERDGYLCLNPYCNSKDPTDLTIHHIDYNKQNCNPSNLITVCRSCNSRANTNRTWHKAWYQAIMYRRYNYKY